eukprot:m.472231 g.472231  ORF g.472231 m.472231 type:complete len:114 (-) comp21660_c0_seq23:1282-1623(-)
MTRVERQCPASVINTVGGDAAYVILQVWMVDFSAGPWCGPCTDALRELKTVARQIGNMARIGYCVVVAVCDVCCVLSTGWRDSLSAFLKVKLFFASGGGVLVAPLICSCQHIL